MVGWKTNDWAYGQGLGRQSPPVRAANLMAPRLIELCFQTAGLWEMGVEGRMGLPQHIDRVSLLRNPEEARTPAFRHCHSQPDAREVSTRRLWMRGETAACSSAAIAPS